MPYVEPSNKNQSDLVTEAHWNQDIVDNMKALAEGQITLTFDGGGSELSTGLFARIRMEHDYEIMSGILGADQSGSAVVDIWKDITANYPPTDDDSITASAPLTLSVEDNSVDSTLTDWTVAISAGDWLFFNLDSVTSVEYLQITLKVKRTS